MSKKINTILDLSGLDEECFFKTLINFLVGENKEMPMVKAHIRLLIDDKHHISIFGRKVISISHCSNELTDLMKCSESWSDEDFENFLKQTIKKTKQTKFKIHSYDFNNPNQYIIKILTNDIDWSKTVDQICCLNQLKPGMIVIRSTDHEYHDDDRNIISIENVEYNVSVDSLGLNPNSNTITSCENHLLRLYKKFSIY